MDPSHLPAHQSMIALLLNRSKGNKGTNTLQEALLKSALKQDYIDLTSRLNSNNTATSSSGSSSISELIEMAKLTCKYGIKDIYLSESSKSQEQRLRVYLKEVDKFLRETSEQCATVWKSYKKIIEKLSPFSPKKDVESIDISSLMAKIKSFSEELDDNKYTVSRFNPTENKHQKTTASWIKNQEIPKQKTSKPLPIVSPELKKQSFSSTSEPREFKDEIINLLTKILSSRSIQDMKLIQKELDLLTVKKNQYLQIKQTVKFFIRDQQQQKEETPSPILARIQKQNSQHELSDLEMKVTRLEQQLREERVRFSHLDRSMVSTVSQDTQLIYQQSNLSTEPQSTSPFRFLRQHSTLERQTQVILDIIQKYQQLQQELRIQRERLRQKISELQIVSDVHKNQAEGLNHQIEHLRSQLRQGSAGNTTIPAFQLEQKLYTSQIQKIRAELEEQRQVVQQFWVEQQQYKGQISRLLNEKQEYKQVVQQFWLQKEQQKGQINRLMNERQEYKQVVQQFWVQKEQYRGQISRLLNEKQDQKQMVQQFWLQKEQYKGKINRLIADKEEQKSMVEHFWVQRQQYKAQISKLVAKTHEQEQAISAFFIQMQTYKNQLQRHKSQPQANQKVSKVYKNSGPQAKANMDQFLIFKAQSKLYLFQIQKLRTRIQEYKSIIEQFWVQKKNYISQLNKKEGQIKEMELTLPSFFAQNLTYKSQLLRLKHQIQQTSMLKQEYLVLDKIQSSKNTKIQSLEEEIQTLKLSVEYFQQNALFNTDIFEDSANQKSILIRIVNEQLKSTIAKTKLIYKFDKFNTNNNFHHYIDGHNNLLVVAQTEQVIVGAYYGGAFGEQQPTNQHAFLFSVNNQDCYPCIQSDRAITNDKLCISFGNSQLRLAPESQQIFSNFSGQSCFYDSKGKKVQDFLGMGGKRLTKFLFLQVYELQVELAINLENQSPQ